MTLSVDLSASFTADGADQFDVSASFDVEDGETVVVLGPSGSGKTLLLETIAGFHPHEGTVTDDERELSAGPPESRNFGFVFQDYALFPHMTVAENVAFGQAYQNRPERRVERVRIALRRRARNAKWAVSGSAGDLSRRTHLKRAVLGSFPRSGPDPERLLSDLGVGDLAKRYPPTLSGGERQRVALARALAVEPEAMLLDEPLSALDVPTRQSLRADLQDVLADVTAVYVTHNRTTARALADRLVVMSDGKVVQQGSAKDVFERPASPLVARFTGSNCIPLAAVPALREVVDGDATHAAIRPEYVALTELPATFEGEVHRVTREEASTRVTVVLADADATVEAFVDDPPAVGDAVGVELPGAHLTGC